MTPILLTNRSAPFQAAVLKNEDRWLAEPDVQTITALRRSERRAGDRATTLVCISEHANKSNIITNRLIVQ